MQPFKVAGVQEDPTVQDETCRGAFGEDLLIPGDSRTNPNKCTGSDDRGQFELGEDIKISVKMQMM